MVMTARKRSACGNSVNPLWCASTFLPNTKRALKDTHTRVTHTNNWTVCLIKPLPCVEKVCLLLLSRNIVWVLTPILKYLRAASLSSFAVKWLPLHQWNNNWYDNRFIWASPSPRCYFVEWGAKEMAAGWHFWRVCVCLQLCVCCRTKLDPGQKITCIIWQEI